ncbi:pentapeptide repeat-containing protein [Paenibacillus popilliae]
MDLQDTDLQDMDLQDMDLQDTDLQDTDLQDMNLQDSMDLQDIYADYMSLYIHLEAPLHLCTFSYILHSSEVEIEIDDNTKTITPYLNISYLLYMQTPGKP